MKPEVVLFDEEIVRRSQLLDELRHEEIAARIAVEAEEEPQPSTESRYKRGRRWWEQSKWERRR